MSDYVGHTYKKDIGPKDGRNRFVWTDDIRDGFRHIYIRCPGCEQLMELSNETGTVRSPIYIDKWMRVSPCVICAKCDNHIFVFLNGYVRGEKDIFLEE